MALVNRLRNGTLRPPVSEVSASYSGTWLKVIIMEILFWTSAVLLLYTFFAYPALVFIVSRFGTEARRDRGYLPKISVLVPAFNEETVIKEKLQNCLDLDYPEELLEIIVASDGSTDRTAEIVRELGAPRLVLHHYESNRGKPAVLNETIPKLKGDLVLLTDASGMLNSQALLCMAPLFADPEVGCVGGIYHIFKEGRTHVDSAENSYLGFEMLLRKWEGLIHTTLSGTGAMCMIRRDEYEALPNEAINDDYLIPALLALRGKRVIYEPGAHVYDRISTTLRAAFRRRVRIATGNWQQLRYLKGLLNPLRPFLCWMFVSHKLLRMAFPFLLLALFAASYSLSPLLFTGFSAGLGAAVALSLLALLLDRYFRGRNPLGFVALVFFNCLAVFWGTFRFILRRDIKW